MKRHYIIQIMQYGDGSYWDVGNIGGRDKLINAANIYSTGDRSKCKAWLLSLPKKEFDLYYPDGFRSQKHTDHDKKALAIKELLNVELVERLIKDYSIDNYDLIDDKERKVWMFPS